MASQQGLFPLQQELSRVAGFLDIAEKETKHDFSSLPPTRGPFFAGAESWQRPAQGALMNILFNVEKQIPKPVKNQFFETAIESFFHTCYFLLTHSEYN